MHSKEMLERAIDMASLGHFGQRDKSDAPYILHVLRVMLRGKTYQEMIVGVLHDIVEDTSATINEIEMRFGKEIAEAVDCITHRPLERNDDYIQRVMTDPLARQVKIYDLEDNISHERMKELDNLTKERLLQKYIKALRVLKGEPEPGTTSTGDANAARIVANRLEGRR